MFLKIITSCAFFGTDTTHIVEVKKDNLSEDEIQEIVDEYIQSDIEPDGRYEVIEENELENELNDTGCGLEGI